MSVASQSKPLRALLKETTPSVFHEGAVAGQHNLPLRALTAYSEATTSSLSRPAFTDTARGSTGAVPQQNPQGNQGSREIRRQYQPKTRGKKLTPYMMSTNHLTAAGERYGIAPSSALIGLRLRQSPVATATRKPSRRHSPRGD